jgi:hypothetical protein
MGEGQKVGGSLQGDLKCAGKVKVRHDSSFFLHVKKTQQKNKQTHKMHLLFLYSKLENLPDFILGKKFFFLIGV